MESSPSRTRGLWPALVKRIHHLASGASEEMLYVSSRAVLPIGLPLAGDKAGMMVRLND